jgi:hypothetical protein
MGGHEAPPQLVLTTLYYNQLGVQLVRCNQAAVDIPIVSLAELGLFEPIE